MPLFSIIIVNYNGGTYPREAINSLKAQTFTDFEVLFVDNNSSDGSVEAIDWKGIEDHTLLLQKDNLGFAGGNNLAALKAKGAWLALLNPDAIAAPDWLEKLAQAVREFPEVSSFASAQYDMASPEVLDGAGDGYLVFGFPWRGGFGRPASDLPAAGECFSPCGASACIRRDVFLAHGGFDERYFCYCEDVDLGFRLRLSGERCRFLPGAVVHHAGGGISGRLSAFTVYHGTRNRIWTYAKNMPSPLLAITLPGHVFLTLYVLANAIGTNRVGPIWRGISDGLTQWSAIRREGRHARHKRRVSLSRLARAMAWNPIRMRRQLPHIFDTDSEKHGRFRNDP